jgi:tripartite-type tricarboxylate transporter receptor subunit TctC
VLVVNPNTGITDYADYISKSQIGFDFKLGQGSANQKIQMEYLASTIKPKVTPVIVPYKGGSAIINDILGGHIDVALLPYHTIVRDHISANNLRIIASTTKLIDHPNITVLTKKYKDFPDYGGYCMIMPKNSDTKAVQFWRQTVSEYLSDPAVKDDFERSGAEGYPAGEKFLNGMVKEIQTRFPSQ